MSQMCSIGFRSGEQTGQSIESAPLSSCQPYEEVVGLLLGRCPLKASAHLKLSSSEFKSWTMLQANIYTY